jgi:hypothetical protein
MIKKVLPWVIGTAGILGATSVVSFFFKGTAENAWENLGLVIDTARSLAAAVALPVPLG